MPMNKDHYPKDWRSLRAHVLARGENRCECRGECGSDHCHDERCDAPNGQLIQRRKGTLVCWARAYSVGATALHEKPIKVVLTTAHLCQDSLCDRPDHLLALCQLCHLRLDQRQHMESAKKTRARKAQVVR